jgi:Tfp pilus assembly protein PilF
MIGTIDKRLDKFQGKWPKLILWAEEKYGKAGAILEDPSVENPENTQEKHGVEQTLEFIIGGDHESALKNLKQMISEDSSDSDTWNAFSSYFSSIGLSGRAKACEERAESLA